MKPYIDSDSISEACFKALELWVEKKNPYQYLTINISQPFCVTLMQESPKSLNADDWCKKLSYKVGNFSYSSIRTF